MIVFDYTKKLYKDRWENDILYYTGMGQKSDQSLDFLQNKTLNQSSINGIDAHLFEVRKTGPYKYQGVVVRAKTPFLEV